MTFDLAWLVPTKNKLEFETNHKKRAGGNTGSDFKKVKGCQMKSSGHHIFLRELSAFLL